MKGQLVKKEQEIVEYGGDMFEYKLSKKEFDTLVGKYSKHGTDFIIKILTKNVQKNMKKVSEEIATGDIWQGDFNKIFNALLDDVKEGSRGA